MDGVRAGVRVCQSNGFTKILEANHENEKYFIFHFPKTGEFIFNESFKTQLQNKSLLFSLNTASSGKTMVVAKWKGKVIAESRFLKKNYKPNSNL